MYINIIGMTDKLKTSDSQLRASIKYYHQNKEAINEKRKDYFKEYRTKAYALIREDEDMMTKKREYAREYMRKKRAADKMKATKNNCVDDFDEAFLI